MACPTVSDKEKESSQSARVVISKQHRDDIPHNFKDHPLNGKKKYFF